MRQSIITISGMIIGGLIGFFLGVNGVIGFGIGGFMMLVIFIAKNNR